MRPSIQVVTHRKGRGGVLTPIKCIFGGNDRREADIAYNAAAQALGATSRSKTVVEMYFTPKGVTLARSDWPGVGAERLIELRRRQYTPA